MKKTVKMLAIVAVLMVAMLGLTGCGANKKDEKANVNPIVGSWKYESGDYIYTFKEDGTGEYSYYSTKMEFTYKTEGDKLSITYKGSTAPFETTYEINGDKLNVKDSFGKDTIYKKQ